MAEPDFRIWKRSGASKTVRFNGWATINRDGKLTFNMWEMPFVTRTKARAMAGRRRGERVVRVTLAIKEGHA